MKQIKISLESKRIENVINAPVKMSSLQSFFKLAMNCSRTAIEWSSKIGQHNVHNIFGITRQLSVQKLTLQYLPISARLSDI